MPALPVMIVINFQIREQFTAYGCEHNNAKKWPPGRACISFEKVHLHLKYPVNGFFTCAPYLAGRILAVYFQANPRR